MEYSLTELGRSLIPILDSLIDSGPRSTSRPLRATIPADGRSGLRSPGPAGQHPPTEQAAPQRKNTAARSIIRRPVRTFYGGRRRFRSREPALRRRPSRRFAGAAYPIKRTNMELLHSFLYMLNEMSPYILLRVF